MNPSDDWESNDPDENPGHFSAKVAAEVEADLRAMGELLRTSQKHEAQKYKLLLAELQSGDEIRILQAVTTLASELVLSQEEQMQGVPLESLLTALISALTFDGIPELICKSQSSWN